MATVTDPGMEALEKLKSTEPPVFLAPSSISEVARVASQYLFTKLKPHNPKSPFVELLVDGFDAEQIWQQIDMQSQPLLSSLRHEVKRFAKNPEEILKLGNLVLKVSHENDDIDEMDMDELEEFLEEGEAEEYGTGSKNKKGGNEKLSTHEKERLKVQSKIEQMEKANLDPKHWTMQGEITAAKRPKNSALEVDLDFEHNARPAPVITEEVTATLEDLIKNRVIEARFDDVQRAPSLPTKSKREAKELDDSKSKKGLAEVYEAEYVQKANPAFAPATFSDELKKEASILFKKLCLKLDALSHFHFTPKPIIEEMNIQTNVPAIAMEEVAPVAVSDAAMLAPEEIFAGKGNIKDESELTQEDRKRRRAKKKRKFKAESANQPIKKARDVTTENPKTGSEQL
ncbi:unnamed protein product [Arabis nemorensis]|uniref:Uncharacterized protein n=1 Tax=Arabis nemorensis TaxID=586526 RepID=A0A565CXN4_9BRAS|nr:unnamed protein product [Arabis nemorensis]